MKRKLYIVTLVGVLGACLAAWADSPVPPEKPKDSATVYVPYKDIAAILVPAGKTVLMDRAEFAKLLAAANANTVGQDAVELGEITSSQYVATVKAGNVEFTGELTVVSMSDKPVAVPMNFAQIGLAKLQLDDKPAPLGFDGQGRLCLVVTGKGKHRLNLEGSTTVRELAKGGMEFSAGLPAAVAGTMKLTAPGDLEIHASVPIDTPVYDKAADKSTVELTLGGQSNLTVTLLGNGRAEDQRAILLGESAEAVQLTGANQVLTCQYTVQVLRRGVRELQFTLPTAWTITDVTCPNMVKWSVQKPVTNLPLDKQTLTVRLRNVSRGMQEVSIKATAKFSGLKWQSPAVSLVNADYQRGYMLVDTGDDLKVKNESLTFARRENTETTAGDNSFSQTNVREAYQRFIAGTLITAGSRLYYHWGQDWQIALELAVLESRVSSDERQTLRVSVDGVTLEGRFQVTAVGKELFDVVMELPNAGGDAGVPPARAEGVSPSSGANGKDAGETPATHAGKMPATHAAGTAASQQQAWNLEVVLVNGKPTGFEYRLAEIGPKRVLTIELAKPIPAEGVAEVAVLLRHAGVRKEQLWPTSRPAAGAAQPFDTLAASLIRLRSNTTKGLLSVETIGDIDVSADKAPPQLKPITVGRMGAMGLGSNVQLGWTYTALPDPADAAGATALRIVGRLPRISADSVGLLSVQPGKLIGDWRVTYNITRASARTLYLLVDKSLGQNVTIEPYSYPSLNPSENRQQSSRRSVRLTSKAIVPFSDKTIPAESVSKELSDRYNLWQLTLDGDTSGLAALHVHYEFACVGQASRLSGTENSKETGETPVPQEISAPLVRPVGRDQFGIKDEMLAIQAGEELAVTQQSVGASEVDAIDLLAAAGSDVPSLPAAARRLLWALRLESPLTPRGAAAGVTLKTTTHDAYSTPPALVLSANYTTFLDAPEGGSAPCRTEATFSIVNSGRQFLDIRLPKDDQLWSIRVGENQAKPKRGEGNQYLVSIPRSAAPLAVKVVYAGKAAGSADGLALQAATLEGVPVNQVHWTVHPPPGYRMQSRQGQLAAGDIPAYEQVLDSFQDWALWGYAPKLGMQRYSPSVNAHVACEEFAESPQMAQSSEPTAGRYGRPARPATQPSARPRPEEARQQKEVTFKDQYGGLTVTGRYTLPVELVATPGAGLEMQFAGLGSPSLKAGGAGLDVSLVSTGHTRTWWGVGFALVALLGVRKLRRGGAAGKAAFVITIMLLSSLLAIWSSAGSSRPDLVAFLNGAFFAAMAMIAVYLVVGLVRWIQGYSRRSVTPPAPPAGASRPGSAGGASGAATVASMILAVLALALAGSTAFAADAPNAQDQQANRQQQQETNEPSILRVSKGEPPLVIPYDDPARATESTKILVPYGEFIRMWNLAHPDKPMEIPAAVSGAAVADVKYSVTLVKNADANASARGKLEIQLQMQVVAPSPMPAKGIVIPMPLAGMAVSSASFNGKPAALQVGPGGMVLALPGEAFAGKTTGELKVSAVTTPRFTADSIRSGRADLGLPALPGAVMTFTGLEDDVVLEALLSGSASPWTLGKTTTAAGVQWTIPLGQARDVSLRWNPKAAAGAADKTLSASAAHDVYAFHWAVLGVSKITYTFSAGTNDRFALLLPEGAEIRDLTGPNIRDHRIVGDKTADGEKFKVVEVRLHRPATKSYQITLDWLGKLPSLDQPQRLSLPRAADVGRESGTVTLHAAGGMTLKVMDVTGGRKSGQETSLFSGQSGAEAASRVGQYYWPYRPFAITVQLTRAAAAGKVKLDQLVRVEPQRVQLFVDASVTAKQGKLFDASFALPAGYELLSAVGPAVADWYVQTTPTGLQAHVSFRSGVDSTRIALALLKEGPPYSQNQANSQPAPAGFSVPIVTAIDALGAAMKEQTGRLAIQLAASLEAQTLSVENLKSTAPSALRDWLGDKQSQAVQFAYWYEKPAISLSLKVRPLPTKVRVEILSALGVRTTAANYSYRLRYTIEGSPIDRVSFTMPTQYAPLAAVSCPSLRNVTTAVEGDRTRWTLTLVNEITGLLDVGVNFSLPIDSSTDSLPMPRIVTDAPAGYRAVVVVQNLSRHELAARETAVLAPMPSGEQVKFLRRELLSSLQFVWESYTDNWSLTLKLTPAKTASRISKVVDLLALTTVIDRDGQARYEARIALQNRSEQFLRVRLPKELELWSAVVADQPVKPVRDSAGAKNEVLIPLVKTSAGGLPYDVKLYLAGRGSSALGSITKIQPPAIELVGIDVQRTTWSLRLPAGYDYETRGAGGNMSPIAGQAEKMTIEIDASLDQVKRYSEYNNDSVSSVVSRNFQSMNARISRQREQTKQYIEGNREKLSKGEYSKLNAKLQEQDNVQYGLTENWKAAQRTNTLQLGDNNINGYVGSTAVNPGLRESDRDKALTDLPEFFDQANKGNIAAINEQIEGLKNKPLKKQIEMQQKIAQKPSDQPDHQTSAGELLSKDIKDEKALATGKPGGGNAGGWRYDPDKGKGKEGEKDADLGDAIQTDLEQGKLAQKQSSLAGNRANRAIKGDNWTGGTNAGGTNTIHGTQTLDGTIITAGGGQAGGVGGQPGTGVFGPGNQPNAPRGAMSEGRTHGDSNVDDNGRGGAGVDDLAVTIAQTAGGDEGSVTMNGGLLTINPYVSGGTYSIPVQLPDGEVQLDFAHPAGGASVAVLAISQPLLHAVYGTIALAVVLIVLLVIRKIWRRVARRRAIAA